MFGPTSLSRGFSLALFVLVVGSPVVACRDEGGASAPAVDRTGGAGPTPATGGASGSGDSPTPGTGGSPTPGTGGSPTPGTGGSPTPGTGGSPTPGTGGSPTPGTGGAMTSDAGSDAGRDAARVDTTPPGPPDTNPASCKIEEMSPPNEGGPHSALCAPLQHRTNPPSSGLHYPTWAAFRAYDKPVPWGFLLHAMEHGAVIIAYNCPNGCAAEVAEAKALMESVPRKSACPKPRPPVIVVPDPKLDVRFAAAAWGHILRASCFDRAAFARFITAHVNMGPEFFPNDCGATDLEAAGWCP